MNTALRALLSVLMLVGFYVLAVGMLVGCAVLTVTMAQHSHGPAALKFGILTLIVAAGIVTALVQVARAQRASRDQDESGVYLTPGQAPELWAQVRELADLAGTRAPDTIELVPEVNAAVSEETRLLGLVGGTRQLLLGVPLLQGLTVAQLRSVLAHELGHYSNAHTRLGPIAYRGRAVVVVTVSRLSGNIVGWLLRQYAKAYLVVSQAVSRSQELEADRLSVQVAGRRVAQSTLRELPVIDAAWSFYERRYLAPGWAAGYATTAHGFFGGFGQLLTARSAELEGLRGQDVPGERSVWDSHPPIPHRVAAMDRLPETRQAAEDPRPATALVPGFDQAAAALAGRVVAFEGRQQLEWGPLVGAFMDASAAQAAQVLYDAAAAIAQQPSATLGTVLDLVERGWGGELARSVAGDADADEQQEALVRLLTAAFEHASVRSGTARWQGSWSEPATVVAGDGNPIPFEQVARLAADQRTVASAREWLVSARIDLATGPQSPERAGLHQGASA